MTAIRSGLLAVLAMASAASAQERWRHPASGASLPTVFEGQRIAQQRDLGSTNDTVVNYEAATGLESTTIYVYRAAVPRARLWFERALPIVAGQIPMAAFDAGPVERVATMGAAQPNALRQIFVAKQAGPFRTTALLVAQSGPWIVKVRASSATLDRTGLAARLDRHLGAMTMVAPAFPAGLDPLPPCAAALSHGGGKPLADRGAAERGTTAGLGIVLHARASGPSGGLCQVGVPGPQVTMLGVVGQPSSWLMLLADAGRAIGAESLAPAGLPAKFLVYAVSPVGTTGAAVFDGAPPVDAALQVAAPSLRNKSAGLFTISATADAKAN